MAKHLKKGLCLMLAAVMLLSNISISKPAFASESAASQNETEPAESSASAEISIPTQASSSPEQEISEPEASEPEAAKSPVSGSGRDDLDLNHPE